MKSRNQIIDKEIVPFTLEKTEKNSVPEVIIVLEDWKRLFAKKRQFPTVVNAESIVSQMLDVLKTEKHGFLWLAKHPETHKTSAVLIANDLKNEIVIRFLVSNVLDKQSKGAGKFLVSEISKFANIRNRTIRTTSQNAKKFWENCPGFQFDHSNPPDFIHKPVKPDMFFQEDKENKAPQINKKTGGNNRGYSK